MDMPPRRSAPARASARSRAPVPWRAGPARAAARFRHLHGPPGPRSQVIAAHYSLVRPSDTDNSAPPGVTPQVTTVSGGPVRHLAQRCRETCRTRYVTLLTYT